MKCFAVLLAVCFSLLCLSTAAGFGAQTAGTQSEISLSTPGTSPSSEHQPGLDGRRLSLWWAMPFVGILLSIALMPLLAPHFWHHHFGKVAFFWALCFLVPFLLRSGPGAMFHELLHTFLLEYLPFIILLLALFTVAGGVRMTGSLIGSPSVNSALLLIGTLAASLMGTTGAAMLLIRPLIRANEWRKYQVHTLVFFIFLVANIGGCLTQLGDPPIFLGFLQGVSFFWPTARLLGPMVLLTIALLGLYYAWDTILYRKESGRPISRNSEKLGLEGGVNLLLLGGIVGVVLLSGFWKPKLHLPAISGIHLEPQNLLRDLTLLIITALSWKLTPQESRRRNGFSWAPIVEVAKLFAGIFVTIVPAIAILKAGSEGALASLVRLVTKDGQPFHAMYFWLTGALSSFLDNAPTYLVFFNTAGGNAHDLMHESITLMAISAGAVFFGAMTYIGNAPNFMVKAIAEERGIKMPSFFGYILYSATILLPLFALITWIWFRR